MTDPYQMNCEHSPDGWCLECVGFEYELRKEEIKTLRNRVKELEGRIEELKKAWQWHSMNDPTLEKHKDGQPVLLVVRVEKEDNKFYLSVVVDKWDLVINNWSKCFDVFNCNLIAWCALPPINDQWKQE
jgi:hypothetical protein